MSLLNRTILLAGFGLLVSGVQAQDEERKGVLHGSVQTLRLVPNTIVNGD